MKFFDGGGVSSAGRGFCGDQFIKFHHFPPKISQKGTTLDVFEALAKLRQSPYKGVHAVGRKAHARTVEVGRECAHLIFESFQGAADVVNLALLVKRAHRLGACSLAPARVNRLERHVSVDGAERMLDHLPALVHFGDDPVRIEFVEGFNGLARPFMRRIFAGQVGKHVDMPALVHACDDDASFVRILVRAHGRIDGDDNALQLFRRQIHAVAVEPIHLPECAGRIGQQFGV